MPATPLVTIYTANINTARSVELCVRSLKAHTFRATYRLHVCDGGSEDRSLPVLTKLLHDGDIDELTIEPNGRSHSDWLDWWMRTCPTKFAVVLDSDIEILDDGWLPLLCQRAINDDCALVTSEIVDEVPGYVDHTGVPRRLARRPAPWMMLFQPEVFAALGSWKPVMDVDSSIVEGWWGLDTGAALLRAAEAQGIRVTEAPPELASMFRHYGGMSWVKALESRPGWRLKAKALKVRALDQYLLWRLARVRFGRRHARSR